MSVFIAMCLFAFSMSFSPGPTTIITMSTGVNYGFRRAFPFILGATIGFSTLLTIIGLGIGQIAAENQMFLTVLSYLGSAFIAYMGYKIVTSSKDIHSSKRNCPSLRDGALLQFVNVKAWIASLAGISAFNLVGTYKELLFFVILFNVIGASGLFVWAYAGSRISRLLGNPRYLRIFNVVMGGSLILVAIYLAMIKVGP